MHYHVIKKSYQRTYNNRTEWITLWNVEVTYDHGYTHTLCFTGRLCLKRGLKKLDQQIKEAAAKRQAEAQAKAATLKKRYVRTWWGVIDSRTGQVVVPKADLNVDHRTGQAAPKPRPKLRTDNQKP